MIEFAMRAGSVLVRHIELKRQCGVWRKIVGGDASPRGPDNCMLPTSSVINSQLGCIQQGPKTSVFSCAQQRM